MKIKFTQGRPAVAADIENLQRELGSDLPGSFVEFLRKQDGAKPETNIFRVGSQNESGVNGFIPLRRILSERDNIENIPTKAFPIAWAEGGNYVFIDIAADGGVFFWDHEQPESPTFLAASFTAFIDMLSPFDSASVKLDPNQVKRALIDPDFLKSLDQ